MTSSISSLVRMWKIRHSSPRCTFVLTLRVVYCQSLRRFYLVSFFCSSNVLIFCLLLSIASRCFDCNLFFFCYFYASKEIISVFFFVTFCQSFRRFCLFFFFCYLYASKELISVFSSVSLHQSLCRFYLSFCYFCASKELICVFFLPLVYANRCGDVCSGCSHGSVWLLCV